MFPRLRKLWQQNQTLLLFLTLMCIFRSAVADWNTVPTASMKPTIVEGDRIWVDKLAYDLRLPFTLISLYRFGDPKRGDIIVFESKVADKRLVKRVVGVPGDRVSLHQNRLVINGRRLDYEKALQQPQIEEAQLGLIENLLGVEHAIMVDSRDSVMSSFHTVDVPEGYYLVLGDNRDNSADSRVIGLVPRGEVIGKTENVVVSLNYDNFFLPRKDRFFKSL